MIAPLGYPNVLIAAGTLAVLHRGGRKIAGRSLVAAGRALAFERVNA